MLDVLPAIAPQEEHVPALVEDLGVVVHGGTIAREARRDESGILPPSS
jgi:hypothetical protein